MGGKSFHEAHIIFWTANLNIVVCNGGSRPNRIRVTINVSKVNLPCECCMKINGALVWGIITACGLSCFFSLTRRPYYQSFPG